MSDPSLDPDTVTATQTPPEETAEEARRRRMSEDIAAQEFHESRRPSTSHSVLVRGVPVRVQNTLPPSPTPPPASRGEDGFGSGSVAGAPVSVATGVAAERRTPPRPFKPAGDARVEAPPSPRRVEAPPWRGGIPEKTPVTPAPKVSAGNGSSGASAASARPWTSEPNSIPRPSSVRIIEEKVIYPNGSATFRTVALIVGVALTTVALIVISFWMM